MQLNLVARQRLLSPTELERLCQRRSIDIARLANFCGHTILPGQTRSLDVGTAINMLIYLMGEEAGFELGVMTPWLPRLRNDTLFRLAEDLDNWDCPEPSPEWQSYIPNLCGVRENTRPYLKPLLPGICIATAAWKVRFFSASDVEILKDEDAAWPSSGRTPLLVINADDLAQRIKSVCGGPLFTVRPRTPLAA